MRYLTKDESGTITGDYCGNKLPKGAVAIPESMLFEVGQNINEFNADFSLKTLSERVKLGYVKLSKTQKISDDGKSIADKTDVELCADGLKDAPAGYKLNEAKDAFIEMTGIEKVSAGIMTLDELKDYQIKVMKSFYLKQSTSDNKGIMSLTLGAEIDCRQSDILNVKELLDYMEDLGVGSIEYKCKDNKTYIQATKKEVEKVLKEIRAELFAMWTKQDKLEKEIRAAKTAADVITKEWSW